MNTRIIVAALIKRGEQILLGQKPKGVGPYPDTWHIPGGGINLNDEKCEEAVRREIKEETGLRVKNLKKVAWDTDIEPNKHGELTHYIFLQFSCDYDGGDLIPGDDMSHFEWVSMKDAPKFKLNKPTRILLEKLRHIL
jgi:ADP-ribose pyrophosphatase YjhB (NUDIX family)